VASPREAAEQADAAAQNNLGLSYALGQGVPQDNALAVYWTRKAAEQGHAKAQVRLGVSYYQGQGATQDYAEAYFWLDLAISTGKVEEAKKEDVDKLRDGAASDLTPAEISQVQERVRKWLEEHPPKVE
jgi:hypothetical protein